MSFICFRTVDCGGSVSVSHKGQWGIEREGREGLAGGIRVRVQVRVKKKVEEGTNLARLSSTEKQHFNFILGQHAITLKLVLDLVIACKLTHPLRQKKRTVQRR